MNLASYKKGEKGEILVAPPRDGDFTIIDKGFRTSGNMRIDIIHALDSRNGIQSYLLMNGLRTNLMYDGDSEESTFCGRERNETAWVQYYKPCIMFRPRIDKSYYYLINQDGGLMAGSNIYSAGFDHPGALCLGDSPVPFNFSPVESLLINAANADLEWRGQPLVGGWEDGEFIVDEWPTFEGSSYPRFYPPPEIKSIIKTFFL